jgi:hypothetical protein
VRGRASDGGWRPAHAGGNRLRPHRLEDLFALPERIASIEPEYRFWLDHHTIHQEETVLYADARG